MVPIAAHHGQRVTVSDPHPALGARCLCQLASFPWSRILLQAPMVYVFTVKPPIAAHPEARQLPLLQEAIHGRAMHAQIFSKLTDGNNFSVGMPLCFSFPFRLTSNMRSTAYIKTLRGKNSSSDIQHNRGLSVIQQ
jgi:hypothetical protein